MKSPHSPLDLNIPICKINPLFSSRLETKLSGWEAGMGITLNKTVLPPEYSNREETPTCRGVLSSNTESVPCIVGAQKREVLLPPAEVMESSHSKWHLNWDVVKKTFFQMEKGREGLFTHIKWHEKSSDRNKECTCDGKLDGRTVVAGVISWNQILKGIVCKVVKLCFTCEAIRTHQRIFYIKERHTWL